MEGPRSHLRPIQRHHPEAFKNSLYHDDEINRRLRLRRLALQRPTDNQRRHGESTKQMCQVVTGCLAVANSEAVLACADLPPLRHVAQERATLLRERLLCLEPEAPAHETAKRQTRPRLKSRSDESWKRGHEEKTDPRRP